MSVFPPQLEGPGGQTVSALFIVVFPVCGVVHDTYQLVTPQDVFGWRVEFVIRLYVNNLCLLLISGWPKSLFGFSHKMA